LFLLLITFFFMATMWAPLVEELTFRGAFFRHLRSGVGPLLAALISAIVFGLIHPVPLLLTIPLMTLGFAFALMREWRGSIVAPMTAHWLHNTTVLTLIASVVTLVGG
jgi:membrane protease YdiL (CAAX protease family)